MASRDQQGQIDPNTAQQLIKGYGPGPWGGSWGSRPTPDRGRLISNWALVGRVKMLASDTLQDVILLKDGSVVAFEYLLDDGQYGRKETDPSGLTNVVMVGALSGVSYALKQDGTLVTWNSAALNAQAEKDRWECHPNDC